MNPRIRECLKTITEVYERPRDSFNKLSDHIIKRNYRARLKPNCPNSRDSKDYSELNRYPESEFAQNLVVAAEIVGGIAKLTFGQVYRWAKREFTERDEKRYWSWTGLSDLIEHGANNTN
jgi:hypothetical protein